MRRPPALAALVLLTLASVSACRDAPLPPPTADAAPTAVASATATATASAVPAPPPPVSPEEARRGNEIAARAERCLADFHCNAAEATRLTLEAADAGAPKVDCFRLYYGIGVTADLPRARICFERAVSREKVFAGASPSLQRVFLGLMLLDGQGGARDSERGNALFVDCYMGNDSGVSAAATAREKSGEQKPIDFCEDIGGTTLDTNACAEVTADRAIVAAQIEMKEIVAALAIDKEGFALWDKAESAWGRFSFADTRYAGDAYRNGSMRIAQESWITAAHARERADALHALLTPKPSAEDAEEDLKKATKAASAEAKDAENRRLYAAAEAAWQAYRTAERAFVRRALAAKYGSEAAAVRALDAELASRRAEGLRNVVKALRGE